MRTQKSTLKRPVTKPCYLEGRDQEDLCILELWVIKDLRESQLPSRAVLLRLLVVASSIKAVLELPNVVLFRNS